MPTLEQVLATRVGKWKPETNASSFYDFRYRNSQSAFGIPGDVMDALRGVLNEQTRVPVAWDRIQWSEPWEEPVRAEAVPLIFVDVIDGLLFCDIDSMPYWLHLLGIALRKRLDHGEEGGEFDTKMRRFVSTCRKVRREPDPTADPMTRVHEAMENAEACTSLRETWIEFVDACVIQATKSERVKSEPVLVIVFEDLDLTVNGIANLHKALRSMSHPRLLCLYTERNFDART
jgi:hypothetical protein